ncbi:nucleoside:proton symporter [Candidatus Paracaedimonas acanthamoebae]|nr:nucleoside:proton symporter [Candidatus Paracaedimonas acanthamoebae]
MPILQAIFGLSVFLFFSWLISENRKNVNLKFAFIGVFIQFTFAFLIMKVGIINEAFLLVSKGIGALKNATCEATRFVFGYLGGGETPFSLCDGASTFIFAFQALPMLIVISAISMLLFHWRVLPFLVRGFSWALQRTLNVGGALGVCSAAKVFLGQTEAPLLIRPYFTKLSRSELFSVMTAGMATTSASIMVIYSTILENTVANPISHILTASIISIPAAITISRLMVPQEETSSSGELVNPYNFSGSMDAISQGASDGMKLYLNIIAMLIATLALVALVNTILESLPNIAGSPITLQRIFGFMMSPVTWLMGISWNEASIAGNLLGTKTVLNEVIAFIELAALPKELLSKHSDLIMVYALCGFANLSSIGIQIGGLGTMAPERRNEIIALGFKAVIAGTLSSCMSGTIVGILYWLG